MVKKKPEYEKYLKQLLIALYEAHQDPKSAGVRAHGFPGALIAVEAGIVSEDEIRAGAAFWTSKRRWEIVAALRELIDRGWVEVTDKGEPQETYPDRWFYRLTARGKKEGAKSRRPRYQRILDFLNNPWVYGTCIAVVGTLVGAWVWNACAVPARWPGEVTITDREGRILEGVVRDASNGIELEGARVSVAEEWVGGDFLSTRTVSDGSYVFQDLKQGYYKASADRWGYRESGRYRVDLYARDRARRDFDLVPDEAVSARPFEDGTLESLFPVFSPLSPIEGEGLVATLAHREVVSLNVAGFERQMILASIVITNSSKVSLFVDLSRSHMYGQTAEGWLTDTYDERYEFDPIGSQFLPNNLRDPLVTVEGGESIAGNVAFFSPEELTIASDLRNITLGLFLIREPQYPWQPEEFELFHDELRTLYIPPVDIIPEPRPWPVPLPSWWIVR